MHKSSGRGMPGGMGSGQSGLFSKMRSKHKISQSKGGGNRRGGINSSQVHKTHSRHKMNNNKIISSMRGK